MKQLSDVDRGVLVGILSAEGSFGGDGRQPQVALKFHPRRQPLGDWLVEKVPGSKLYGPYESGDRVWHQWMCRGEALRGLLLEIEPEIRALDAHAAARIDALKAKYRL